MIEFQPMTGVRRAMIEFQPMTEILQPKTHGIAEVRHFEVTDGISAFSRIRACQHPEEYSPPGKFAQLYVNNQLVMSDTQMEQDSNGEFMSAAREHGGDILIAGLGLGMIVVPLLSSPLVRSVTVVEKHQDVVDLVCPMLRDKCSGLARLCKVITADIKTWTPSVDCNWNIIYFDIWPNICEDYYEEILALKDRFKPFLRRGGWIKGWMENQYLMNRRNRRGW